MRTIAEQIVRELGGRWSVLTRQKLDHIKLDRLLDQLERTEGASRRVVMLRIQRLVFPHAFAEEAVLWPVIRRTLDDGYELTLEVEREHQEVNELVLRLGDLGDSDSENEVAREMDDDPALAEADIEQIKLTAGSLMKLLDDARQVADEAVKN